MTVKTEVSRFHIHDELTAPDESAPIIKSLQVGGRSVNKLVGVLAGSPAVLRAYTRMRAELQAGELPKSTRHRIALAAALLVSLKAALEADGDPPLYLHEETREAGWDDEQILEALAHVALGEFQSLMAAVAALPKDQATPKVLPQAA